MSKANKEDVISGLKKIFTKKLDAEELTEILLDAIYYIENETGCDPVILEKEKRIYVYEYAFLPDRIITSGNRTIVFWKDGEKTIIKLSDDDTADEYSAFCIALAKKLFRNNSALKKIIEKARVPQDD